MSGKSFNCFLLRNRRPPRHAGNHNALRYIRKSIFKIQRRSRPAERAHTRAGIVGNPETVKYTGDNSKSPAEPKRSITAEQFAHRMILRRAMLAHGFKPIDTEWWHFTLKDEPFPETYFTFPVKGIVVRGER